MQIIDETIKKQQKQVERRISIFWETTLNC